MRVEFLEDYEGVGVYQRIAPGRRLDDEFQYGVYHAVRGNDPITERAPLPLRIDPKEVVLGRPMQPRETLPGETSLRSGTFMPAELSSVLLDTEEVSGLQAIRYDKRPYAIQALQLLRFQQTSAAGADPLVGQASYVMGTLGSGWVNSLVAEGYMVMIATASVPSGSVQVLATKSPQTIAYYATREQGYAMVDGPTELATAAAQYKAGNACPVGYQLDPDTGQCAEIIVCGQGFKNVNGSCVPVDENGNGPAKASTGVPEWAIYGAIALVGVGVVALVIKT